MSSRCEERAAPTFTSPLPKKQPADEFALTAQRYSKFAGLRVACLIDTHMISGPGRQLAALAREISRFGVNIRIVMFQRRGRPASPYAAYLQRAGIDHIVLPERGPLDVSIVPAVANEIRSWLPDIVQSHGYRATVVAFLLRRLGAARPWVAFFHGATDENWRVRLYHRMDRALLPLADRLVVMSEHHRRLFNRANARVRVIYNAVIEAPAAQASISLEGIRSVGQPLVGAIGRLSPEKGFDILLDAAHRRLAEREPISVIIAGDGPERENLRQQVERLGLTKYVHFLGALQDVTSLYRQLDLVVIPSRSEGLPNVLLEALQADVPVVATAVGAIPEVLAGTAAGEIVPPGDMNALADAIARGLRSGRTSVGSAARSHLAQRFCLESRILKQLAIYAELRPDRVSCSSTCS